MQEGKHSLMDPSQLAVPVAAIIAAAAVTFYTVSFLQMSEVSHIKALFVFVNILMVYFSLLVNQLVSDVQH